MGRNMRHRLTKAEMLKGTRKALANPRTPRQFVKALRKRLRQLEK
jgi:hypothetical protein